MATLISRRTILSSVAAAGVLTAAGMSPAEREHTAELIKRISKTHAIIIIEHYMEFVSRIASKVTVLHLGRILAEGSMEEIHNNPKVVDVYLGH